MKLFLKRAIPYVIFVALATVGFFIVRENTLLRKNNKFLTEANKELSDNLTAALKIKTYAITLAPEINNKVTSAFGSTKNVTFQYFFKMDGNTLDVGKELKPDSVLYVQRVE